MGNGVVVIYRNRLIDSLIVPISRPVKFLGINKPTQTFAQKVGDKITYFLRKIKNLHPITEEQYICLCVSDSYPGILYGLSKIHKRNMHVIFSFGPIFSSYNNTPLTCSKFTIENLYKFSCKVYFIENFE